MPSEIRVTPRTATSALGADLGRRGQALALMLRKDVCIHKFRLDTGKSARFDDSE